ncbi:MAG: DUF4340 domain-containing protein [Clostridia bacterium]|nr:DUF4340 domain-containing protein [Clostridia bacterium]
MTRRGKTLLALGILAALFAAGWLALTLGGRKEPGGTDEDTGGETVVYLESDLVTFLRLEKGGETITLSRENEELTWTAEEYPGVLIDEGKIDGILDALCPLTALRRLAEGDREAFGLGDGATVLTAGTAEKKTTLRIGDKNPAAGGTYLSLEGEEEVFLVPTALGEAAGGKLLSFLRPDAIPRLSAAEEIEVNGIRLVFREQGSDRVYSPEFQWFFAEEGGDSLYAGTEEVEALLDAVEKASFREVAAAAESGADRIAAGLREPEAVFRAAWREDGEEKTFALLFGKSFQNEEGETLCCAMIEGSSLIGVMDAGIKETVLKTDRASLAPHTALPVDWDTVDAVEITSEGETHRIALSRETGENGEGETAETVVFREGERTLDRERAEAFFDFLSAMKAEATAEGGESEGDPVFSMKLIRNVTGSFREMTFELAPYDALYLRVRFDRRELLLVSRTEGEKLLSLYREMLKE